MSESKNLEWDLRQIRIRQIGRRLGEVEDNLTKVYQEQSLSAAEKWFASMRVLWFSIREYVDEEEDIKKVDNLIEKFNKKLESENPLKSIDRKDFRELYQKVNRLRIEEAGLDIPAKEKSENNVEDFY